MRISVAVTTSASSTAQLLGILNEKHLRRRQNSLRKFAASLGFELVPLQNLAHSVS
jgi:hypothetical protein